MSQPPTKSLPQWYPNTNVLPPTRTLAAPAHSQTARTVRRGGRGAGGHRTAASRSRHRVAVAAWPDGYDVPPARTSSAPLCGDERPRTSFETHRARSSPTTAPAATSTGRQLRWAQLLHAATITSTEPTNQNWPPITTVRATAWTRPMWSSWLDQPKTTSSAWSVAPVATNALTTTMSADTTNVCTAVRGDRITNSDPVERDSGHRARHSPTAKGRKRTPTPTLGIGDLPFRQSSIRTPRRRCAPRHHSRPMTTSCAPAPS